MMRTILLLFFVSVLIACSGRTPEKPPADQARKVVDRAVTIELLQQCDFVESEGGPGIYSLIDVPVGEAARKIGFELSDLRPTPSQERGSDVRIVDFRNAHFVVRARRRKVDGVPVAESLDDPESICTISVAFPRTGEKE
jgi:hypothetical protein